MVIGAPAHPLIRFAKISAVVALLALAATSALAANRSGNERNAANATIRAASDNLSISNSHSGGAVFSAGNIAPGGQATGTVAIGNAGNIPGDFTLAPSNLIDTPGPNGGALSAALNLTVEDLTTNSTIYSGKLNAFGQRSLGTWQPGQSRSYRFTATLPDTGAPASTTTGDNLYRGSSTSVALNWTASGEGTVEPPPPPPAPLKLTVGSKSQKVKSGKFSWTIGCSAACTVKSAATVNKQKGKKGKPKKLFGLKVTDVSVRAGAKATVSVKLSKGQVKKVKKALKKRYKVSLAVKSTASTAGGAKASTGSTMKIKP